MPENTRSSSWVHSSTAEDANPVLREYWNVIVRRRSLIAAVAAAGIVASAVFSFTRTSTYRATAILQIAPAGTINLVDDRIIEEARVRYDEFFATQQAILRSRNLAERVMDELQLWDDPLFAMENLDQTDQTVDAEESRLRKTEKLLQMAKVSAVGATQLLEISYVTPRRDLSAKLANTLARQYVTYAAESTSGVARTTSSFISDQIAKLQREIKDKEQLLQSYSQRDDLVLLGQGDDGVTQQIQDLNRELAEVQAERAEAAARFRSLENAEPDSFAEILDNRTIEALKREQAELERRYTDLSARFLPGYPEVQRTRAALEEIEERLARETKEIADKVIGAAQVRYEIARRREAFLLQTLDEQREQVRQLNVIASDFRRVKLELDNQRTIHEQLLRRQSATGLSAELGKREPSMSVRLVDEAVVPLRRYRPKHRTNLVIGAFVGLALGVGIAIFLQYRDGLIYTEDEVPRYVGLTPLGSIERGPQDDIPAPSHYAKTGTREH